MGFTHWSAITPREFGFDRPWLRRRLKGMKQMLVMIAVLVGCGKQETNRAPTASSSPKTSVEAKKPKPPKAVPEKLIANPIVEKTIRERLKKPEGELTEADLEKLTTLSLAGTKITDAGLKDVAKLKQLTNLILMGNPSTEITDAGLKELAKLQQLKDLYLGYTKVTKAGEAELQK
ncbi:MAG: hypothetical protein VYB66_09150, partial [Verrucomicrobiota bacterium]|nr:hypothetical protein [Verrucomicrobiota bacterium]